NFSRSEDAPASPAEQTELYIARYEMHVGTSLEKTDQAGAKLSKDIKEVLGDSVDHITIQAGTSKTHPLDPGGKEGDHAGLVLMYMTRAASLELNHKSVLAKLREIETSYLQDITYEAEIRGPPVGEAVNATFHSNNMESLNEAVDTVVNRLKEIEGIVGVKTDENIGKDEVHIKLNYPLVARLGLNVSSIGNAVKAAVEGIVVTTVNKDNRKFDMRLELDGPYKMSVDDIKNIRVRDMQGNLIPLSKFSTLERTIGSKIIKHFDYQRSITVTAGIIEEKISSMNANQHLLDIYQEFQEQYPEVGLVFGGQQENTKESLQSLAQAMMLALIAIFAILVFVFKSYLRPIIIMTTIPLGLFGFAVAFYLHERPTSFLALIGIVGLAGIIVNNGIVLISFIEDLRRDTQWSLHKIFVKASGMRLRAVVVTSLTTMGGLFPTAYGIGGNDTILIPMTLAMAWGLAGGTLLTLLWVPCAYAITEDITWFFNKIKEKIFGKPDIELRVS
ncbi:MAG: efflux RND transporter permease subunit, partial [Bacteriovoracia bacterium]